MRHVQHIPSLDLGRNIATGSFVIINFVPDPQFGYLTDFGPLIHVSSDTMRECGSEIVLNNLSEFHDRVKTARGELGNMARDAQRAFSNEHLFLGIEKPSADTIVVIPTHQGKRGGLVSAVERKEDLVVKLPILPQDFYEEIMKAFELCGG
jgi:hypothetical protein